MERKINDTLEKWLVYGMPEALEAKNLVAQEYGFQYYQIAGCIVDSNIEDSAINENDKLEKIIAAEYGKSWKKEFDVKVEDMENRFREVYSIVTEYKPYIDRKGKLEKEGYYLTFEINPQDKSNLLFEVITCYNIDKTPKSNFIKDSVYLINIKTRSINLKTNI